MDKFYQAKLDFKLNSLIYSFSDFSLVLTKASFWEELLAIGFDFMKFLDFSGIF